MNEKKHLLKETCLEEIEENFASETLSCLRSDIRNDPKDRHYVMAKYQWYKVLTARCHI